MGLGRLHPHDVFQRLTLLADFQLAVTIGLFPGQMGGVVKSVGVCIRVQHFFRQDQQPRRIHALGDLRQ